MKRDWREEGKLVSKDVFGRVKGKDEKEKGRIKVGEGKVFLGREE